MSIRTNFKEVLDKLKQTVKATATDEQMQLLGEKAAEMIRVRTRLGYGVDRPGGKRRRLDALSDDYIEFREEHARYLSGLTEPDRSNLTLTGQMLDSVTVTESKLGRALIEPTGTRKGSSTTNQQVATGVTKGGRPFISLSDMEIKKLRRYFEKDILGKTLRRRSLT